VSLDVTKLEKVVRFGDTIRARCPACWTEGLDKSGQHLRIFSDGKFGCALHPQDREHRRRIWQLAGGNSELVKMPVARREPEPVLNVGKLLTEFRGSTRPEQLLALANQLGVAPSSLVAMGTVYAAPHHAWAWPMFDGQLNPIGVRLRYWNGEKRAIKGSHNGIFAPQGIAAQAMALIVEGVSDCLAAITLGYFPIGQPSCGSGIPYLCAAIRRFGIKRCAIIADNKLGEREDPGLAASQMISKHLPVKSAVLVLPAPDIRSFLNLGGTSDLIESMLRSAVYRCP
jgi:hypothetical protein